MRRRLIPVPIPPLPPMSLNVVSFTQTQVVLQALYLGPPPSQSFTFQRSLNSTGPWQTVAIQASPNFTDTTVTANNTYFYRANVVVRDGRQSPFSTPLAVTTTVTVGFSPQPGITVTGNFAFDGVITVIDSANTFATPGPLEAFYDDGRNGVPGTTVANFFRGLSGTCVWEQWPNVQNTVIWGPAGSNASGNGCEYRMLNNERAGGTGNGPFGRNLSMTLQSSFQSPPAGPNNYLQFYLEYHENWHGSWDGANNEGGGGGYYKQSWFTHNRNTLGPPYFDLIPNDWLAQSSTSGVPSPPASGAMGGNSDGNNQPPGPNETLLPPTLFTRDGGPSFWDPNGWNTLCSAYLGNTANPTSANGVRSSQVFNNVNGHIVASQVDTAPLFSSITSGTWNGVTYNGTAYYASFSYFNLMGLMQECGSGITNGRSNVLLLLGDATHNAACRLALSDSPNLSMTTQDTTNKNFQSLTNYTLWTAGEVQATIRQGRFATLAGAYLYRFDALNNPTLLGQFI